MFGGGGAGIRLMRFRGVDVTLDLGVVLMILFFFVPQAQSLQRNYPWSTAEVWSYIALISVLFVGSILIHELSHAIVGMLLGAKVTAIRLYFFGGATFFSSKPTSEGKNFWISAAGPLSNLALWGIFRLIFNSTYSYGDFPTVWIVALNYVATINLLLAAFNALPGYPMDGGQALRSGVIWLTKNTLLAARVVAVAGCLVGGLLVLWAVQELLSVRPDSITVLFRGLIAFWIIRGSLAQLNEVEQSLPVRPQVAPAPAQVVGVPVGQVMTRPPQAWTPDTTVGDFLQQSAELGLDDNKAWLPVLREGYLQGMLNRRLARKVGQAEQTTTTLEKIMLPRRAINALMIDQDVGLAWEAARASKGEPVAVIGAGGYFAGYVTKDSLGI